MGEGIKIIAQNRKARYDYSVDETYECGLELLGTEVKSFRDGKISFPDAWAEVVNGEVWLRSLRVAENPFSSVFNKEAIFSNRVITSPCCACLSLLPSNFKQIH